MNAELAAFEPIMCSPIISDWNSRTDASCRLQIVQKVADLQDAISEGATSFLVTEYKYMGVFMVTLLGVAPCSIPQQLFSWLRHLVMIKYSFIPRSCAFCGKRCHRHMCNAAARLRRPRCHCHAASWLCTRYMPDVPSGGGSAWQLTEASVPRRPASPSSSS